MPPEMRLPVTVERQAGSNWCWAAVAHGVARYYGALGRSPFRDATQCDVARRLVPQAQCPPRLQDDRPEELHTALDSMGHYYEIPGHPLTPQASQILPKHEIQEQISTGYPIGCRIEWTTGQAHFVLIVGYRAEAHGRLRVWVCDPRLPSGSLTDCDYGVLLHGYTDGSGTQGYWTHAILTQPNPA